MATTRPIAVILLLYTTACDRAESPPGSSASFPAPTAVFREVAGSRQDLPLSAAAAIVADDDGRVYVADSRALEIIVLDSDGTDIGRIGRRGDGPGEFRDLRSIAWKADTLAAMDFRLARITLFDRDGHVLSTIRWPEAAGRAFRLISARDALIAMGMFPSSSDEQAIWNRHARYFRVDGPDFAELAIRDTIDEPTGFDCDGPRGTIHFFNPFFGHRGPLRAFPTPERLASVRTGTDLVDLVDTATGDTTNTFLHDVPAVTVTDDAWARATTEYREAEQRDGPFSCSIDAMRPSQLPRIRAVIADDVGRLWTEVHVDAQSFAFVVTDTQGRQVMFVPAPPRDDNVAPYIRGNRLYIVSSDQYDVPSIHIYELADVQ